jgi:hypothetical protein
MFLDGSDAKVRDAIRVLFAREKLHSDDAEPAPDVVEVEQTGSFRVVPLAALVRMELLIFARTIA